MRRCIVPALGIFLIAVGCGPKPRTSGRSPTLALPETIRVRSAGTILSVPLEEYVLGSVLAEVSPINESPQTAMRMFEVQAILARTYVTSHLGKHARDAFDVCDSTHCQLYDPGRIVTSRFALEARAAIHHTSGVALMYGPTLIDAVFHADCGGFTAAADSVWGGPAVPYLIASPDDVRALVHRNWRVAMTPEKLRDALNADARSRVGRRFDALQVLERDSGGRATLVVASGELSPAVRGEELRSIVNRSLGDPGLQSTRFAITRSPAGGFVFDGSGYGHGVGLCQRGALARARAGESVEAILGHYFPGTALRRVGH